jgi:hypothetical protein
MTWKQYLISQFIISVIISIYSIFTFDKIMMLLSIIYNLIVVSSIYIIEETKENKKS